MSSTEIDKHEENASKPFPVVKQEPEISASAVSLPTPVDKQKQSASSDTMTLEPSSISGEIGTPTIKQSRPTIYELMEIQNLLTSQPTVNKPKNASTASVAQSQKPKADSFTKLNKDNIEKTQKLELSTAMAILPLCKYAD